MQQQLLFGVIWYMLIPTLFKLIWFEVSGSHSDNRETKRYGDISQESTIPTPVPEEEQAIIGAGWWWLLQAQGETEGT